MAPRQKSAYTQCEKCGADFYWLRDELDTWRPINRIIDPEGEYVIFLGSRQTRRATIEDRIELDGSLHRDHRDTCAERETHER